MILRAAANRRRTACSRPWSSWGVSRGETVYVGDSDVDVETARNAGITGVAVSWGFRTEESLRKAGAQYIAATPQELLAILERL